MFTNFTFSFLDLITTKSWLRTMERLSKTGRFPILLEHLVKRMLISVSLVHFEVPLMADFLTEVSACVVCVYGCYGRPWLFRLSQAMTRGKRSVKQRACSQANCPEQAKFESYMYLSQGQAGIQISF